MPVRETEPLLEPVYISHQTVHNLAVRVAGAASDRHTVVVTSNRYDRQGKIMVHSSTTIQHVRQLPSGQLTELGSLVQLLIDRAKKLSPSYPVELGVDVTRSPVSWDGLPGDPMLYMITTTGLDRYAAPYRYLGRLLLLSGLQISLRTQRLRVALPTKHDNATVVTAAVLERALSNVEVKVPKVEDEELMLDDSLPDDDLAITVGLASFMASERIIGAEDLRFRPTPKNQDSLGWVY